MTPRVDRFECTKKEHLSDSHLCDLTLDRSVTIVRHQRCLIKAKLPLALLQRLFRLFFLTPRLIAQESIIFLSLTLSVCMYVSPSVCHRAPANRFLFFVSQWNRAIFGPCVWHSTKRCSSIFDLGPLTPKIYSPKFALWVIEPVDSRSLWVMVCGSKKVGLGAESPYAYRLVDI